MRHIVIVSGLGLWLGLLQAAKSSPYFGQPVPGMTPALFAPGIVSTDGIELNTVFTPDLKEMFFARAIDRVPSMFHSRLVDGAWTTPRELLLFPGEVRALAVDMAVSPDGNELYFLGNYQPPKYFFFSRRQSTGGEATAGDVYWMDAKFLEQFRR